MASKFRSTGWGVALVTLTSAILGTALLRQPNTTQVEYHALSERLPKTVGGWVGEDLPLGTTEVLKTTGKLLNYDDYIYRVYRKSGVEIYVYAMYWRQGSISVREISGHTPDACWVANGATALPGDGALLPVWVRRSGEYRAFHFPAQSQPVYVVWWHLWGDEFVSRDFGRNQFMSMVNEIKTWLFRRRGAQADQLFVRIHSVTPLADLDDNAVIARFFDIFPPVLKNSHLAK